MFIGAIITILCVKLVGAPEETIYTSTSTVPHTMSTIATTTTTTTHLTNTTTATTPTQAMLILCKSPSSICTAGEQHLISTVGELSTSIDFNRAEVLFSCAVTHGNKFYIYGAEIHKRQVIQLVDCGLKSIGTLPFDHYYGACGSQALSYSGAHVDLILLCFDYTDVKQCRYATEPLGPWNVMTESTWHHQETSIATTPGNYE